jgi:hypothetical protein
MITLRKGGKKKWKTPILLGHLERANLNHWSRIGVSPFLPEDGDRSSLRNVVYCVFSLLKMRTMDKVQKPISLIRTLMYKYIAVWEIRISGPFTCIDV